MPPVGSRGKAPAQRARPREAKRDFIFQSLIVDVQVMFRIASGELWKHSTGQKTVLTRSAITLPKVNGYG